MVIEADGAFALENACPHYGVPLSDGRLANGFLECSWHSWRIDVRTGGCLHNPRTRVETFGTTVIDGILHVVVDEPAPAATGSDDPAHLASTRHRTSPSP